MKVEMIPTVPSTAALIGHTGDLLVDIYARNLTHIYILPQCSTTAARVLNPAGMDAQFERLRCAISRGILIDATVADFSPMTSKVAEIFLSKADHAARVAIDEEGVTAAAYTVMMMAGAAAPPEEEMDFVLDRPFLFAITGADGLPLFVGVVNRP